MSTVTPDQRFTRWHPCPVCGGWDALKRHGHGRCQGMLSPDGHTAFCMQVEHGPSVPTAAGPAWRHPLDGPCGCGRAHGAGRVQPTTPPRATAAPKPPTWQCGSFPATYHERGVYVADWHYADADGRWRFSVVRYNLPDGDKTYLQARWRDDGSAWAWGVGDVAPILYQLPELVRAPRTRPVFICEGEQCAEAVRALGLVATCAPMGAGKWRRADGRHEALRGRPVVVLPDHDAPGRDHAADVAADLAGVASLVRVVPLPGLAEHGDVKDWLAAGGTKDALYELVIATPAEPGSASRPASMAPDADAATALRAREEALRQANAKRQELERQDAWRRTCSANRHLSPATKTVAVAVRDELVRKAVGEGDELTVYLPTLAKRTGLSAQTAGEALKRLAECGALDRRVEQRIGAGGIRVSRVAVSRTPLFATPAQWTPPAPRNHGGKRCPHCGGSRFVIVETVTCADCGAVIEHKRREVSIDEVSGTSPSAMPTEGTFTGSHLDFPLPEGKEKGGAA